MSFSVIVSLTCLAVDLYEISMDSGVSSTVMKAGLKCWEKLALVVSGASALDYRGFLKEIIWPIGPLFKREPWD